MNTQNTYLFTSHSVEDTQALARELALLVQPGDVITLDGDLGAGKTHFTQGFGAALGVGEDVVSPTFTLMHEYVSGSLPLYHFDLYRLEDAYELEDIAFYEYVEGVGVSIIEWAKKFPEEMPDDILSLCIAVEADGSRTIEAKASGSRSLELLDCWAKSLKGAQWMM